MSRPPLRRALIRLAYLSPLLCACLFVVYGFSPQMWFVEGHEAYETMSLYRLLANTFSECHAQLEAGGSSSARSFSYLMSAATIVFWVMLSLFVLFALATAAASTYAFALPPTDRRTNRAKRLFALLCPGRILYLLSPLMLLVASLYPQLLQLLYRTLLGHNATLHASPFFPFVPAILAVLLPGALFFLTLPWQKEEHLDLFRIYRAKATDARRESDR